MKGTRQFILDTLLPYKEDPTTCGYDGEEELCKYLTDDGKKCAVGKHLIEGEHQQFQGSVYDLDRRYELYSILTDEAKEQDIALQTWSRMQSYHDSLAEGNLYTLNKTLDGLEASTGFKFDELRVPITIKNQK